MANFKDEVNKESCITDI